MKKKDVLENIIQELKDIGGIKGSAIVSRDGLVIVSDLGKKSDAETFAAMAAAMQGAAETSIIELKQGKLTQIIIESDKAQLITTGAGEMAILVILTEPEVNLGLVLISLKKASKKIAALLE